MLRVTQNSSSAGTHNYFFGYYAEAELDVPKWHGKAAERLGLSGKIQEQDFKALCYNTNPETGKQLTQRNAKNRTVGYDFTFDVPKSVSILYNLTEDKDIMQAFNNSIDKTMVEIEKHAETRVRINGKSENRETGNLVWGVFTHGETRPVDGVADPHLHKHVFAFNATYDNIEAKWKAGQFRNLKANAPYFETVFNSHFATEIQKAGYEIERNEKHFEVKNFNRELIEKYSNRTKQIEDKAKELGITYSEDKASLGAKTRARKQKNLDRTKLRTEWNSRLSDKEREIIANAKNAPSNNGGGGINAREALEYSLTHNLERRSTVTEKELFIHGLKRSYGSVTPEMLQQELLKRGDLFSKDDGNGNKIYTTQAALDEEKALKYFARNGRGALKPLNPAYTIKNEQLTHEQANAVQHVLKSKDFITIVSGGAGTGKTWSIKEVASGVKETGVKFGAFAPSSAASRQVQRKDGFKDATTIAELLKNKQLQEQHKNGVIWIDEAGMVGNKTMNSLIQIAKQQDARILLTGDIKQHNAVERGDALRIIQKYGGVKPARINKIQRQKKDDYRNAVKLISEGNMMDGIKALDKMKAIKEAPDFRAMQENVANEYVASIKAKEESLIVATTHAQGKIVTGAIREKLKEAKILKGKEQVFEVQHNLAYTEAEKGDIANYRAGMAIQFHQNVKGGIKRGMRFNVVNKDEQGNVWLQESSNAVEKKKIALPLSSAKNFSVYEKQQIALTKGDKIRITQNGFSVNKERVNNGNILSVKGFDDNGNIIASSGKRDLILGKDFGNLTHGYYTTSPASQGKSVNRVIIMQGASSGKAANKEQFYVSASRGKFAISIHTDDKEQLIRSVSRSSDRMTATEIVNDKAQVGYIKEKLLKLGTMYRAVQSKVAKIKTFNYKESIMKMSVKPIKPINYAVPGKTR